MLIICSHTRSRNGMARVATLAGRIAAAAVVADLLWLGSIYASDRGANSLSALLLHLGVQVALVAVFVVALAARSVAAQISSQAGNGMPELEFRDGTLRLYAWPGADAVLVCAWAGVRGVTVTPAEREDARWRRRWQLSDHDVRHMVVARVRLERDANVRVRGSMALRLLWWAWAPWRLPRQFAGKLQLEVLLCTAEAEAPAVLASLGPLAGRMDLRERFGAAGHVWQLEVDAQRQAVLMMAGRKHSERVAELLDRDQRPTGTWI